MGQKNERVELEMKIIKYRAMVRQLGPDNETLKRPESLIPELEQKRREIDE